MSRNKRVVVIPMKENNQRLSGKNVKLLGGTPLYQWCLSTMCEVDVDRIVLDIWGSQLATQVTTELLQLHADGTIENDAPEISVIPRIPELRDEMIGGDKLLAPFVTDPGTIYMQAHVTSPFVSPEAYTAAFEQFDEDPDFECTASVTSIQQRVWYRGTPVNFNVFGTIQRTQDLTSVDVENGAFFAFRGSYYLREGNRFGTSRKQAVMSLEYPDTVDIDTAEDFEEAERVVAQMAGGGDD